MKTTIEKETEKLIQDVKENRTSYVICPKCNRGSMEYGYRGMPEWVCLWKDCCFVTNEIPSEDKIRGLINLKEGLKDIIRYKI